MRDDLGEVPEAQWIALRPGSDTAFILALCHVLIAEGLYDRDFVSRCTTGFDRFAAYVEGSADGQAKDCAWAAPLAGCSADEIRTLARRMAGKRTMVNMAWSLQRSLQGEQPFFALVALCALLGQIGTPGGGIGLGYACFNDIGADRTASRDALAPGRNPVEKYIPSRGSPTCADPGPVRLTTARS